MSNWSSQFILWVASAMVLVLVGCDAPPPAVVEVVETREVSQYDDAWDYFAYGSRFSYEDYALNPQRVAGHPMRWTLPEGWFPEPLSAMRIVSASAGAGRSVEITVSALGSDGGGLAANLNRWRGQMGQPELTPEEIEGLESVPFLRGTAVQVVIDGDYTAVGEEEAEEGYRLVGVVHETPELTLFARMVGPKDQVEREQENFVAFCASLEFRAQR
jgi:hypothetical protein